MRAWYCNLCDVLWLAEGWWYLIGWFKLVKGKAVLPLAPYRLPCIQPSFRPCSWSWFLWLYSQSQPVHPPKWPISSIFALIGRLPPQRIFLIPFWCFTTRLLFISPKYAQSLPDMFWSRPKLAHLVPDFAPPQNISNGQVVYPRVVSVRTIRTASP